MVARVARWRQAELGGTPRDHSVAWNGVSLWAFQIKAATEVAIVKPEFNGASVGRARSVAPNYRCLFLSLFTHLWKFRSGGRCNALGGLSQVVASRSAQLFFSLFTSVTTDSGEKSRRKEKKKSYRMRRPAKVHARPVQSPKRSAGQVLSDGKSSCLFHISPPIE